LGFVIWDFTAFHRPQVKLTIYDTDRLEAGGVSHERGRAKVSRIYDNMQRVFEIADHDKIPAYLAVERVAEERIRRIAAVQKYRI
jgi:hypothetical protein